MKTCTKCGKNFDAATGQASGQYCAACAIAEAERHIPLDEPLEIVPEKTSNLRFWITLLPIAASMFIIFLYASRLAEVFRPVQPVRSGHYSTDKKTDQCIANLWAELKSVKETAALNAALKCPVSHAAYRIQGVGRNARIECPNPAAHHAEFLSVNIEYGIPEWRAKS